MELQNFSRQKKILIVSFTDAKNDPRVYRQVENLKKNFQIFVVACKGPEVEGVPFYPVTPHPLGRTIFEKLFRRAVLLLGMYEPFLRLAYELPDFNELNAIHFDGVIVNDAAPLPLGFKLAKGAPVLFDAHEYYPALAETDPYWRRYFQRPMRNLCKKYIPRCAKMITVSPGLKKMYKENFDVIAEVMPNAPDYQDIAVKPVDLRQIKMIHHGGASRTRQLEKLIELMRLLDDRFTLDFMLVPSSHGYLEELKDAAKDVDRIRFLPPVPMQEIVSFISSYDIGIHMLNSGILNHCYTVPNKLYEFMQARLCALVPPTPGMSAVIREYNCGLVAKDFTPESFAEVLNKLTLEQIMQYKNNSDIASRSCHAGVSCKILNKVINEMGL